MKKLKKKQNNEYKENTHSVDKVIKKYSFILAELSGLEIEEEYKRLKKVLKLGTKRLDYSALAEAIDDAAENARSAGMLWLSARDLREAYENNEYALRWSELVDIATKELEKLRREKKITGQIGTDKIKNWIIKNMSDEYEELTERLRKLKNIESVLEILKNQWESRKTLLQSQGKMAERKVKFDDE